MLDYFGLVPTEKSILMSIIPDYIEENLINDLKIELKMEDIGKGIGFIVPLSSSSLYVKDAFKKQEGEIEMKKKEIQFLQRKRALRLSKLLKKRELLLLKQ